MSVNKKYIGSDVNNDTQKYCPFCKVLKYRTEYHKNKARHDGLDSLCKLCTKEKRKKLLSTPEGKRNHNECGKKWREENKEKYQEIHKRYREKNKDKLKEKRKERREYNREYLKKLRQDPVKRMRYNVSRQVNHAIKRSGNSKKGESVFMYLPYTLQQLKEHLESQFDCNMNWDNYGSYWHIDHITPHSSFSYKEMTDKDFQLCWALSNLRPLEAIENIKKSNKIPTSEKVIAIKVT